MLTEMEEIAMRVFKISLRALGLCLAGTLFAITLIGPPTASAQTMPKTPVAETVTTTPPANQPMCAVPTFDFGIPESVHLGICSVAPGLSFNVSYNTDTTWTTGAPFLDLAVHNGVNMIAGSIYPDAVRFSPMPAYVSINSGQPLFDPTLGVDFDPSIPITCVVGSTATTMATCTVTFPSAQPITVSIIDNGTRMSASAVVPDAGHISLSGTYLTSDNIIGELIPELRNSQPPADLFGPPSPSDVLIDVPVDLALAA